MLVMLVGHCQGLVTGTVRVDGPVPEMERIDMSYISACKEFAPAFRQAVIADKDGNLANVVLSIEDPPEGNWPLPDAPAVIRQKCCMYEPHVLAMRVGQKLMITNEDAFAHNPHPLMKQTGNVQQQIPQRALGHEGELDGPKVAEKFRIKCDIHGWMVMHVCAFEHPFFAVSDANGRFSLPTGGLRDGDYKIEAWHELFGVNAWDNHAQRRQSINEDRLSKQLAAHPAGGVR